MSCGALVMVGQAGAVGSNWIGGTLGRTGQKEELEQGGPEGEQAAEEGQFDGVGGLSVGLGAGDKGEQGVELGVQLLYNQVGVGRHRGPPVVKRWRESPYCPPRRDVFQLAGLVHSSVSTAFHELWSRSNHFLAWAPSGDGFRPVSSV